MNKKIIMWVSLSFTSLFILLLTLAVLAMWVYPRSTAFVLNKAVFKAETAITDEENNQKNKTNITTQEDLVYPSAHKNNTFDLYYPASVEGPLPLLIWVHGGGYLGGDKEIVKEFAAKLAADNQLAILSMNYELAPESQYPNQLNQVDELTKYLLENKEVFPLISFESIFYGGDSAGAQIALQYLLTQTNETYAQEMSLPQRISRDKLKGAISYCGPVNLVNLIDRYGNNQVISFTIASVSWSIIGSREWQTSPQIQQASIAQHVDSNFVPTYITDGNYYSFEDQGESLKERLDQLGVANQSLFFTDVEGSVGHEYQFDYSTSQAAKCFKETEAFLNKYK
ncbi:alpha/beta hydrolase [Streptococcaceae bacterium ESL0687]|nr:alpha/beta hydrolase [Streptococcaceae bacterium ESL0687]